MTAEGALRTVRLAEPDDPAAFRAAARRLLRDGVPPEHVAWQVVGGAPDLFAEGGHDVAPGEAGGANGARVADDRAAPLRLPAFFVALCDRAALHADAQRHALLYRLAWRLLQEPDLRHDPLDADRLAVEALARTVGRDIHRMTAFVRLRPVAQPGDVRAPVTHVAWYEPAHHVLRAAAPFFSRRFANLRWAILTPERSVRWDGEQLEFGPGARRADAPPPDAGEALWLTYYASIFNPARLNLAATQRHMPRRFWAGLPEATLIAPLADAAAERSARMVAAAASAPVRRRPAVSLALRPRAPSATLVASADGVPGDPPASLANLAQALQRCRACPIGEHATQAVPGQGPPGARLMLVGEQPGEREDLAGLPFVGPAGQLLDRALERLGWPRERLFVTNAVKHFKFELRGKRRLHKTPAQQEAAVCLDWLEREIALVNPVALVALGATAARSLLGRAVAVLDERGRWVVRDDGLPVLVTLHPSALLRGDRAALDATFEAWVEDLAHATGVVNGEAPPPQG